MPHRRFPGRVVLGVTLLAACSTSGPVTLQGCRGQVAVAVTEGTVPTFSWTPECLMSEIVVARVSDDSVMWRFGHSTAPSDEVIRPPISYGVTQPGVVSTTAQDLQTGTEYLVLVLSVDIVNGGGYLHGEASFTP